MEVNSAVEEMLPRDYRVSIDVTYHFEDVQGLSSKQCDKMITKVTAEIAGVVNSHLQAINDKMVRKLHENFDNVDNRLIPTRGWVKEDGF